MHDNGDALRQLLSLIRELLERFLHCSDASLSFPATFLSLSSRIPKFVELLPKRELLPLLSDLDVIPIHDVFNFKEEQDRKICMDFFSQANHTM